MIGIYRKHFNLDHSKQSILSIYNANVLAKTSSDQFLSTNYHLLEKNLINYILLSNGSLPGRTPFKILINLEFEIYL